MIKRICPELDLKKCFENPTQLSPGIYTKNNLKIFPNTISEFPPMAFLPTLSSIDPVVTQADYSKILTGVLLQKLLKKCIFFDIFFIYSCSYFHINSFVNSSTSCFRNILGYLLRTPPGICQ